MPWLLDTCASAPEPDFGLERLARRLVERGHIDNAIGGLGQTAVKQRLCARLLASSSDARAVSALAAFAVNPAADLRARYLAGLSLAEIGGTNATAGLAAFADTPEVHRALVGYRALISSPDPETFPVDLALSYQGSRDRADGS